MRKLLAVAVVAVGLSAAAVSVEWTFPRDTSCHEGLAFSDGITGVLVWGGVDTVKFTVGRSDLWDHRGGYAWTPEQSYTNIVAAVRTGDAAKLQSLFSNRVPENWGGKRYNPYMLPLGRVVVKVPGATLARGVLDPMTGLGELVFRMGGNEFVARLAMSRKSRAFSISFPPEMESFTAEAVPATDFAVWNTLEPRGFRKAVKRANGFDWSLPVDDSVSLDFRKCGTELAVWTSRRSPLEKNVRFSDVRDESRAQWADFWRHGARVTIPDASLQRVFDYGMYRFGAMTDPEGVAAGLQGPWLEDDRLVPWNGDYHFNINVQECYSPAYRGGHFENLLPLFRMVLSWRPTLRENARRFVDVDGYVLPHSVDDRGVCIGGFWTGTIDHASTAWVAALMYRYVRYSGDVDFLRNEAYDFMKGAMRVYRAMMEERDGRLSIPLAPSPEWGASDVRKAVGRDASFQLAAAHRLARDLIAAAKQLGEDPDPQWLDIEARLPSFTAGPGGIQLFEGQPFVESHRHHSHLAGLYPFDTIDMKAARTVVQTSYETWVAHGTGQWTGWCVPWASVINTHLGYSEAAVAHLHDWETFFTDPGHGSHHDAWNRGYTAFSGCPDIMQMDGQCAAVTAVLELLAHEVNGKVEFFRGCPKAWKSVSFENLALSDGRRVSGRRIDGRAEIRYLK